MGKTGNATTSICKQHDCLHRTSQEIQTRTHRTTEYRQAIGHKINMQKSVAFLQTTNEHMEIEIKNTLPLITAPKKIKYLGVHPTKHLQDLING